MDGTAQKSRGKMCTQQRQELRRELERPWAVNEIVVFLLPPGVGDERKRPRLVA